MKRGFDPEIPEEYKKAIALYQKATYGPVITPSMNGDRYWCQISASFVPGELKNCLDKIKGFL